MSAAPFPYSNSPTYTTTGPTYTTATTTFVPKTGFFFVQPFFKDIGKRENDLLTKEFPSDKKEQRVEWKSVTANGQKLDFTMSTTEGRDGHPKTVGTIKDEYFHRPIGGIVNVEANTEREGKVEVSFNNKLAQGLKTAFGIQGAKRDSAVEYYGTIGVDYKSGFVSATSVAEVGRFENALKASVVVGSQGVSFGANADYLRRDTKVDLREFKTSVAYALDSNDIIVYGKVFQPKGKASQTELGANYYHRIDESLSFGAEIKFDVTTPAATKKPEFAAGASYRVSEDSIVKARFDTNNVAAFSLSQNINKAVKLVLGTTVDFKNPSASKHGFTVAFTP